jgi:hypothetical protein
MFSFDLRKKTRRCVHFAIYLRKKRGDKQIFAQKEPYFADFCAKMSERNFICAKNNCRIAGFFCR